jgi:hypothetical protein
MADDEAVQRNGGLRRLAEAARARSSMYRSR